MRPPLRVIDGDGSKSANGAGGNGRGEPPSEPPRARRTRGGGRGRGPRVHKLRLGLILAALALLAVISTVFGMMMAVAQDLPSLETTNEFKASRNSELLDNSGHRRIAVLTGKENRILVESEDISPSVKHAVVAIEDRRFYQHKGVDYQGIARAIWEDVRRQRAAQGGSTITQQFVKNALLAQSNRSVFQKLKEAALAYQLERKWTKDKILTQYLNSVYFGEGAYGIESAARVYFGKNHPGCEPKCARALDPAEAAMLAGLIASPSSYSPIQNPAAALERRDLVLDRMRELKLLTISEYGEARKQALPPRENVQPPRKISKAPYFTAWLEQQLVDRYGTGATFGGGLRVRTTLDLDFQLAAEQAVGRIAGIGPSAALVALDNKTGGIRAMVGGTDFEKTPFNLATQGHRQPGSAFKPFTLVAALEKGISPGRTFASAPKRLKGPRGEFKVENYEDRYSGVASLAAATTVSDNSVYAEVGYQLVGTARIARVARRMGIRTRLSTNPAMVLGGLRTGLTPLEVADSYLTLAHDGSSVSGTLAAYDGGPVAFTKVDGAGIHDDNETETEREISEGVAKTATQILQSVVTSGTGRNAAIGEFAAGKTGTTENYQDAWFVGFTDAMTVAVWVGYPDSARPMETEYRGEPVAGGTYPAEIWRTFLLSVKKIREARALAQGKDEDGTTGATGPGPAVTAPLTPDAGTTGGGENAPSRQRQPTPRRDQAPGTAPRDDPGRAPGDTPQPTPGAPPPGSDPGTGGGTGGGETGGGTGGAGGNGTPGAGAGGEGTPPGQ